MPVQKVAMPLLQLLESVALFRREKWLHVAMRLFKNLVNIMHGLFAFRFQLRSGAIDDRRDLLHLLRGELQFAPQALLHVLRHGSRIHSREKVVHVDGAENPASRAGEKHQHEGEDQFPAQRFVHSPRLLWMALSTTAYSAGRSLFELDAR